MERAGLVVIIRDTECIAEVLTGRPNPKFEEIHHAGLDQVDGQELEVRVEAVVCSSLPLSVSKKYSLFIFGAQRQQQEPLDRIKYYTCE